MAEYKAAVIGLGRMGSTFDDEMESGGTLFKPYCHGPTYYYSDRVELVGGADLHDGQRAIFGERWGLSSDHMYSDYREMIEKEKPDIVSVCTTPRHRSSIVQDLVKGGVKAIWAEKPITLTLEAADEMVGAARDGGVALAINCARRWMHGYSEARAIIESGDLGDVLQVTAHFPCGLSSNGSHLIDTIRYLAGGDVKWVFGEMESDEAAAGDIDPYGNGYLAFDNGARAFLRSMYSGEPGPHQFIVLCEKGTIVCDEGPARFELTKAGTEAPYGENFHGGTPKLAGAMPATYPLPLPPQVEGTGITILNDLIEAMETGRPPRCSGEDGLKALEIGIAVRESHRRGGVKVDLPLEDRSLRIMSAETIGDDIPKRVRREEGSLPMPGQRVSSTQHRSFSA